MSNYLELAQLPDGTIVLRRSDDHDNPIVKIEFSGESKDFLQGQELNVAKEECLKQLNDERQRFELLTEEVAIELYKLLAIWEHERRERTQI